MQKRNIYYEDLINDKVISRLKVNQAKKKSFINFMKSRRIGINMSISVLLLPGKTDINALFFSNI